MKVGFDNDKYLSMQSEHIKQRIDQFGGKLYLEFGGKLFDDYHASRVLPGFHPDSKISMLMQFKDSVEAIIAINSNDIEKSKKRGDLGISYDMETLRLIDMFTERGIKVCGVVLTRFSDQPAAKVFEKRLNELKIKTYHHYTIDGYPSNIAHIVSEEGFGRNDYVETDRPLVVVTAPGPGSGKMAVCLSQMYNEKKRGSTAGYAKFETFPIWNLPLKHPVNLAYEAATADLDDNNMIDPFHLEAYGKTAVNYNRDVETFPVLNAILEQVLGGSSPYRSPTDMGVNMAGYCITDEAAVVKASQDEIIRRYFQGLRDRKQGTGTDKIVMKLELIMKQAGIVPEDRRVVAMVRGRMKITTEPVAAMELADGTLISGKASSLMGASPAMVLNALKVLAGIEDNVHVIAPEFINPVQTLKVLYLGERPRLDIHDVLIALSIYAPHDPNAQRAFEQIPKLRGCEVHMSVIPSAANEAIYRELGIHLTCEPRFLTALMYQQS